MIREILTNEGMFGSFKDIVAHMRVEKLETIEIKYIRTWANTYFDRLAGVYTYEEMKQVIDTEGVLEIV
ncbi:MAG: hypothetical protein GX323_10560 [Clostridiales bacterium]|nr:hypothetical protein [Clostridiales bacterium]